MVGCVLKLITNMANKIKHIYRVDILIPEDGRSLGSITLHYRDRSEWPESIDLALSSPVGEIIQGIVRMTENEIKDG